jgi:hypothetical protein
MFGMLDYRAHKLFSLLVLPVWLIGRLLLLIAIGSGIAIAEWTGYSLPARILTGIHPMTGLLS